MATAEKHMCKAASPEQIQQVGSFVNIDWTQLQGILTKLSPYLQQVIIFLLTHAQNTPALAQSTTQPEQVNDQEAIGTAKAMGIDPTIFLSFLKSIAPIVAQLILKLIQNPNVNPPAPAPAPAPAPGSAGPNA